jgi:hypothetical protein
LCPITIAVDCGFFPPEPGIPLCIQIPLEHADLSGDWRRSPRRADPLLDEHLEIARWAQLLGQPFEFSLNRFGFRTLQ